MSIFEHFSEEEREILRIRAERAANAVRESAQEAVFSALEVTIQSQSYALPIEVLTTVYENVAVVPVPCVPSFVAGIANIRGRILPVFDLAVLLDLPESPSLATQTVVVAARDQIRVALRVDAIGEAVTVPANALAPIPANLALTRPDYLKGLLPDGTALIDLYTILNDSALMVNETVN